MRWHAAYLAAILAVFLALPAAIRSEDAAEHVARAKARLEKREYGKAIAECDKALELDFDSAEAYQVRAEARNGKGEHERAVDDCDQAISINPEFIEAYNARAIAWFEKGKYSKAIADCNQALKINSTFAGAYITRGNVLIEQGDRDKAIADWRYALAITHDDFKILNNLGVGFWKQAQDQDLKAARAEAAGDLETAKSCRQKSAALKSDAKAQWIHGVTANPKAVDIHSNLGYAYSEANDLDSAERHLAESVKIRPSSPRPHNNLGRVLLRRSQRFEVQAREAETKGKTHPADAANAKQLREKAKQKRDQAIAEFEKAVELDPTLLEARLNLGEVYTQLKELDRAEAHYRAILKYREAANSNAKDHDMIANFSAAYFGLARIAFAQRKPDEAFATLKHAIETNPNNMAALELFSRELFLRDKYHDGEQMIWRWLAKWPPSMRPIQADRFGAQFANEGKQQQAIRAWGLAAWTFATSPDPNLRNSQAALPLAQRIVKQTNEKDPLALDTLAAAWAVNGKYDIAATVARRAIDLANKKGKKPLADAIAKRLELYEKEKPYRSNPDGSDRP
jgi:tetratricopeptide (TPR) repeat protein